MKLWPPLSLVAGATLRDSLSMSLLGFPEMGKVYLCRHLSTLFVLVQLSSEQGGTQEGGGWKHLQTVRKVRLAS